MKAKTYSLMALLALVLTGGNVWSLNLSQNFNFDGVLVDNLGAPMTGTVSLTFQIYEPGGLDNCLLFEENHPSVALDAGGHFSVRIGSGTRVGAGVDGGLEFKKIFQNEVAVRGSGTNCTLGYTAASGDGRELKVTVNGTPLSPNYALSPVPSAIVAETLQGLTPLDFVSRTETSNPQTVRSSIKFMDSSNANGVAINAPSSLGSSYTLTLPINGGSSGDVLSTNGAGALSWVSPSGGGSVTNVTGTAPITVATGTTTPVISLDDSGVSANTYGSATEVPVIAIDAKGRITSATTAAISGSGLSSLNGQTGGTQSFGAPGTSGTTPAWSSSSNVHTLNIPMASAAGVTAGLLSKIDYDSFSGKLSAVAGSSLTSANIWVGNVSNQAAAVAMSGDATLANDGTLTLATSGATAGTYKSVTVDAKGRVTAGTNPTTLSGYGITDAVQNLSGVTTMAAGADASKPTAGSSGAVYLATDTQKIYRDNGATWDEIANVSAGGSGDIVNGGNTTGSTVVIGTNDAQSLQLETDNSPAMTILSGGNVGIGTSAPVSTLQVNGGGTFNMPNDSQYFEIKRPTGTSPVFRTSVDSGIAIAQIASASSNPTDAVTIIANRSRGTVSAPTNPETNDVLFSLSAKSGSLPAAKINFVTDGTPTTTVPTRMEFQVADGSSAPMTKMTLLANGNLGIGTASPSEKLHIWGNLRVQGTTDCILGNGSGGTNCTSDRRLKTNISPIASSLEKISKLNGVEFDWNEKSISPGRHDIGVIAQEVQEQFPTAVKEDIDSGFLRVDYAVLVAPLIEAVKELASWLSEHDERLEALEAENAMLKGYLCEKDPNAPMCD